MQPFDYVRPSSLLEASRLLQEAGPEGRILAGGSTLLPAMEQGLVRPKLVIDIKGVPEVHELRYTNSEGLTLGAAVTLRQLLKTSEVRRHYPLLQEAARSFVSVQIRNRATVGGRVCAASPAGDMIAALLCFDAECRIFDGEEERSMLLSDFLLGPGKTALQENEVLVGFRLPPPGGKTVGAYRYVRPSRGGSVTLAGVATRSTLAGGHEGRWRLALVGVGPVVMKAAEAGRVLESQGLSESSIQMAVQKAAAIAQPEDDFRASARYRAALIPVLARRSILAVAKQLWGYEP